MSLLLACSVLNLNSSITTPSLQATVKMISVRSRAVLQPQVCSSCFLILIIRGLSTYTYAHLFKVIQPYLLCHDPRQHITNLTVAFSSSCKAFGMKRGIRIHTPFYGKKWDGSQCLRAGADRSGAGIDGNCCKNTKTDVHFGWVSDPLKGKWDASLPQRLCLMWMQGWPKQPPGVKTWKAELTNAQNFFYLWMSAMMVQSCSVQWQKEQQVNTTGQKGLTLKTKKTTMTTSSKSEKQNLNIWRDGLHKMGKCRHYIYQAHRKQVEIIRAGQKVP